MLYDGLLLIIRKYKTFYVWCQQPRQQIVGGVVILLLLLLLAVLGPYPLF
jgi:hypothetical protein